MLTAHHLSKSFEIQTLFENASFSLNSGERKGLVGPNGCGKTTLIRILAGLEKPTSGHVSHDPRLRIGYLPQGFEPNPSLTLQEIIGKHAGEANALETDLSQAAEDLSRNPSDASLQSHYADLLRRIELVETNRTAHILAGLGLNEIDPQVPAGKLSGGQQTRLLLALVLLDDPQLLLLDEPTNHLDIAMLAWLEDWLCKSDYGAMIVSHDRVFLDHTVTSIIERDALSCTVKEYSGNYSSFVSQKEAALEHQWSDYHDQQAEIRRMRQDILRTREQAAHTERQASSIRIGGSEYKRKGFKSYQQGIAKKVAKKAKSRQKKLERYIDSPERVEKPRASWEMKLEFNPTTHLGHTVVFMEELSIGYSPRNPLLSSLNLELHSGQRVVLTGPNGSGKTTLLRTICGQIPPLSGRVNLSPTVLLGYLAQDQAGLELEQSPFEAVLDYFPNTTETRGFLAKFLFIGDEALKPAALLSYGQRTRLLLARLVAEGCNCLLLDEPLNHLDISSRTQFEQALSQFEGAMLAVVHDRYFIQHVADEIWWVEGDSIRRVWEVPGREPI